MRVHTPAIPGAPEGAQHSPVQVIAVVAERSAAVVGKRSSQARECLIFSVLLCGVVLIQLAMGAYRTERGHYSDEAAHFMNGLLVRDYLTQGLGQNPVTFAEQYYLHYPKVAPLMWPPLFHLMLGLFLLPGWPPQDAALIFVACFTNWVAWRLWRVGNVITETRMPALVAALSFLGMGSIIALSSVVMLDIAVAAFALEATYWLALYVTTLKTRHATLFGLFAAFGCLTKGNGLAILLVPPLLVLLTGRFSLLSRSGLYLAALIVGVLAAPPLFLSYRFDAGIGDFEPTTVSAVVGRTRFYAGYFFEQLGILPILMACVGATISVFPSRARQGTLSAILPTALTALCAAALLFHLTNPHAGISGRYVTMAIAPLIALALLGVVRIAEWLAPSPQWRGAIRLALAVLVAGALVGAAPPAAALRPLGWRDTVAYLASHDELKGRRIVVISDEQGEGALVSEVATLLLNPRATVIRGSKLLATDNWNGQNLRLVFSSAAQVMTELEDLHADNLLVDLSPAAANLAYRKQIADMIASNETRFDQARYATEAPIAMYKLRYRSSGPSRPLRIVTSTNRIIVER